MVELGEIDRTADLFFDGGKNDSRKVDDHQGRPART